MSCGFQLAATGDHYVGIDRWLLALHTYQHNIVDSEIIHANVRLIDMSTLGPADIIIGGPPCPPFSGANIRGNRNKDPRHVERFLEVVDHLKPRYWVMEESPFAAFLVPEQYQRFLCANDFNLYQQRKRLIAGNYPGVTPGTHHRKIHPSIRAQEVKAFNKNMRLSKRAQSCCQYFGRRLTSWELQILMGFPSDYHFFGNYRDRCIQIGNAVCPPVAKAIYTAILIEKDI